MKLLKREELLPILIIMPFLMVASVCQSDCSPTFTLPNILKDQISLQYANGGEQTYSYLFFSGMFSGQPVIGYSNTMLNVGISQQSIQQTNSSLNFYLDVEMQDMYIYFYYNSPNYRWTVASVIFWITSRTDIVIAKNVLKNLNKGQNTTVSFDISSTWSLIDSQSVHVVFLVGIYSNFAKNLTISINPGTLTPTSGNINVNIGANVTITNITVLSVIYNPNLGQFLSHSGTLTYKSFSNQYFNLFNNFVPIYYVLTGINSFSLTGTNLNAFQYNLEVIDSTILQGTSNNKYDIFMISYVSIGVVTNSVCSPCNNYISNGNCADSCPVSTYPFVFSDTGKACLTCNANVGQILNSLSNGCNCIPGYELISANMCASTNNSNSICTGINVIQNGTTCICSPGTYNISGICGTCPDGQIYQGGICIANSTCPLNSNYVLGKCACNFGYMNISNACIPCQQGQYYDNGIGNCRCIALNQQINSTGVCVCIAGYNNINGFCISCPAGTVFNGNSCVTQTCSDNQIEVNGSCVCDSYSIPVGSLCIKCDSGTFANKATNLCDSCISNCVICLNKVTCSQCSTGYIFDFSSLSCYNPNASPTSQKLVTIKSGFPFYTIEGIITDFVINSTSVSAKLRSDLMKMVSLQFADVSAIPLRTYYSQNSGELNHIRVAFYYQGLIPMANFSVLYIFNDSSINLQENMTIVYQYSANKLQYRIS